MIKIDGCESVIFYDGSVRINTAGGKYICLDYSDIKILYKEISMQLELKGLKTRFPQFKEMADIEY
jgi:hypothetical protein